MKKISVLFILLCCFILTGCSNEVKEIKNLNDFVNVCASLGFEANDNLQNYQTDSYIVGSKVVKLDEYPVEMIIYDSEDNANKVQEQQIDTFLKVRNTMVTTVKKKGKNYYEFKMVTNGYYMVSTRVENTLIFAQLPVDYKDKVDSIMDKLGY